MVAEIIHLKRDCADRVSRTTAKLLVVKNRKEKQIKRDQSHVVGVTTLKETGLNRMVVTQNSENWMPAANFSTHWEFGEKKQCYLAYVLFCKTTH